MLYGLLLISCAEPQIEEGVNLESITIDDPSILHPEAYLLSLQDSLDTLPIAVTWHGFSASTFEWLEFRDAAKGALQVSLPLLGGHGRNYKDFQEATWQDWQSGPWNETQDLVDRGLTPELHLCSSTGCALLVNALAKGRFQDANAPSWIVMIDPIVFPAAKILTLVDIVGPLLGNVEAGCAEEEKAYWYCNRPDESLAELMEVLGVVRSDLEAGIRAPSKTRIVVYKSKVDGSADPISALALYKGLRNGDGSRIDVRMVDSKLHVFTRLAAREKASAADSLLQSETFEEIMDLDYR